MTGANSEEFANPGQSEAVSLYCMASMVADHAAHAGYAAFAKAMETVLGGFLSELSPDDQRHALQLSYQIMLGAEPARPTLKLVYSRD